MQENMLEPVPAGERAQLAGYIAGLWHSAYDELLGREQVEYMTEKFQSAEAIEEQVASHGYLYFYLKDGDERIGYCALMPEEKSLFLSKLYLDGTHRGRGIGQRALAAVCAQAGALGLPRVYLTVYKGNARAIRAYEKFGFTRADSTVTDIGGGFVMDDYVYEYKL